MFWKCKLRKEIREFGLIFIQFFVLGTWIQGRKRVSRLRDIHMLWRAVLYTSFHLCGGKSDKFDAVFGFFYKTMIWGLACFLKLCLLARKLCAVRCSWQSEI